MRNPSLLPLGISVLLLSVSPLAFAAEAPITRAAMVRDYGRITFDWGKKVRFSASASGDKLTIAFDREAAPDTRRILSGLSPYVTAAQLSGDGRTLTLVMNKAYKTRSFISGSMTGVDILTGQATEKSTGAKPPAGIAAKQPADAKAAQKPAVKPKAKNAPAAPQPGDWAEAERAAAALDRTRGNITAPKSVGAVTLPKNIPLKPTEVALAVAETKDTAAAAKPAEAPVADAKESPPPAVSATAEAPAFLEAKNTAAPKPAETNRPAGTAPALPDAPAEPPAATAAPATANKPALLERSAEEETVTTAIEPLPDVATLAMPGTGDAAFFLRGNVLWAVFGGEVPLQAATLAAMGGGHIAKAMRLEAKGATAYRFMLDAPYGIRAMRDEQNAGWKLALRTAQMPPPAPLSLVKQENGVLVPLADTHALRIAELTDPASGETLLVVPVAVAGAGMKLRSDLVDAAFLPTAQGIAAIAKSDGTQLQIVPQGILLARNGGLHLSPTLPAGETAAGLLPYAEWKSPSPARFALQRQLLEEEISQTTNPLDAAALRERLAGLFLSEGLATETLGQLDLIARDAPDYYRLHRLAALHGAANFLLYRVADAYDDFSRSELAEDREAERWRALLMELLGQTPPEPFEFSELYDRTLRHYPPAVIQKLGLVAGDLAVNRNQPDAAGRIFDLLEQDHLLGQIAKPAAFLRGAIAARNGKLGEAAAIWQGLADDLDDRFVRARAAYSLVALKLEQGSIERDEAIRQLDALRIVWRGDSLEMNLLRLLADLYIEKKDNVNALRSLREIAADFSGSAEATKATEQMSQIFIDLFNRGGADGLKPMEALSLYYEFRELTPLGKDGDAMIRGLADRLVSVDLLERASVLLNHQIRYRLEGAERAKVGARLGLIYLMNRQPQQALDTLQSTNFGAIDDALKRTRDHLAAKALSDLGEPADAVALLSDDFSDDAQMLRVNIHWAAKDWKNVATSVEEILGNRKDITAPLTLLESEYLLKLALAYVFEKDAAQLQYLRDYFGPLMKDNPNYDVFQFITNIDSPLDTRNFEQVSTDISRIRSFMDLYEKRVKRSSLSDAIQ